jgi:hypothetical protein
MLRKSNDDSNNNFNNRSEDFPTARTAICDNVIGLGAPLIATNHDKPNNTKLKISGWPLSMASRRLNSHFPPPPTYVNAILYVLFVIWKLSDLQSTGDT